MPTDPLQQTKSDLAEIMDHITLADSPVGIDAKFTHAIIIRYLQQISDRLGQLEARLEHGEGTGR